MRVGSVQGQLTPCELRYQHGWERRIGIFPGCMRTMPSRTAALCPCERRPLRADHPPVGASNVIRLRMACGRYAAHLGSPRRAPRLGRQRDTVCR